MGPEAHPTCPRGLLSQHVGIALQCAMGPEAHPTCPRGLLSQQVSRFGNAKARQSQVSQKQCAPMPALLQHSFVAHPGAVTVPPHTSLWSMRVTRSVHGLSARGERIAALGEASSSAVASTSLNTPD